MKSKLEILKQTFVQFGEDDCPRLAAALAYYTMFSLPPLLVILLTLTGVVIDPERMELWVQGQVGNMIGPDVAEQVLVMVDNAEERVRGGFSFGLLLALGGLVFAATGAFAQLQTALNKAWGVEPNPDRGGLQKFLLKRIFSLGMIVAIAFLLLVALVVSSVIASFSDGLSSVLPAGLSAAAAWGIDLSLSLVVITVLFGLIFRVLPDAQIAWRDVWVGALSTAALFVLGKYLISLYIGQSDPGKTFGAAAALAIVLIWVYFSAMIVFLGAEFTQVWARRSGRRIEPASSAVRVVHEKRYLRADDPEARPGA